MNIFDPTPEQIAAYEQWVAERPPAVAAVARRFQPWKLYRLASTGHRVTVVSFGERRTDGGVDLTVCVSGTYNLVVFERNVFGVNPDDLTECDLPAVDELTGVVGIDLGIIPTGPMKVN